MLMFNQSNPYMAAQELASIQLRYAESGRTLCIAALSGAKDFIEWRHYPNSDLVDKESGYEFYYHSHSAAEMPSGEHGHFHVIKRHGEEFHHLIGIALNQQGLPVRLFTTNQWVTGESMASAKQVISSMRQFEISKKGRMSPVCRWIGALINLFLPEIEVLILSREEKIAELEHQFGSRQLALESKNHHVLTECTIDLMNRLSEHLLLAKS